MPYIMLKKYYKYAETDVSVAQTEEDIRWICLEEIADHGKRYGKELSDEEVNAMSTDDLISELLRIGQEIISAELGWGYCSVVEVDKVLDSWGMGYSSK